MRQYLIFIGLFSILWCIHGFRVSRSDILSLKTFTKNIIAKTAPAVLISLLSSQPAFADLVTSPWNSGIKYEVLSKGSDIQPKAGDLVTIRFQGRYKGNVFDDTFKTEEPYFYRCGVGLIVKGLDDSVLQMHVGDKYLLSFGGDLAFPNGKPSAPGKPRIVPGAEVEYEVQLIDIPGIADDFIADVE